MCGVGAVGRVDRQVSSEAPRHRLQRARQYWAGRACALPQLHRRCSRTLAWPKSSARMRATVRVRRRGATGEACSDHVQDRGGRQYYKKNRRTFCSCRGHDDTTLNRPCSPMKCRECTSRRHTRSRDVKRWSIRAALGKKQSGSAPVSIPSGGLPK